MNTTIPSRRSFRRVHRRTINDSFLENPRRFRGCFTREPLPPSSNTGANDTHPPKEGLDGCSSDTALIDWLAGSYPAGVSVEQVKMRFASSPASDLSEWIILPRGGFGYLACVERGNVRIYSEGATENMGVFVQVTGKGCRQMEGERDLTAAAWSDFFADLIEEGFKFSRLDLAFAEREGHITKQRLVSHLEKGWFVGEMRSWEPVEGKRGIGEAPTGWTVYLGSRASNMFVRMYDKAAEMLVRGVEPDSDKRPHVRVEFETKKSRAQQFAAFIAAGGWQDVARCLFSTMEFKEEGADSNKSRWAVAEWWSAVVGFAERCVLAVAPADPVTVEQVRQWVTHQVAPSLALLLQADGGDLAGLVKICGEGMKRFRAKHFAILDASARGVGGLPALAMA